MTAAWQVVLKAMREPLLLVSTHAASLQKVDPHENVHKNHACATAKGIMDVYNCRSSYITITNFGSVDIHLQNVRGLVRS